MLGPGASSAAPAAGGLRQQASEQRQTDNQDRQQQQQTQQQQTPQQQTPQQQLQDSSSKTDQQQTESSSQAVKQMSDKSLQELASAYLEVPAAQIPDSGFVVAGIAGRFPNADNMNELWHNLLNGHDMVRGPDDKRWPLGLWDLPKKAARIKDISRFDNEFFGITKENADYTDHQLRNLYEVVYESLLDAGVNPAKARGDSRTGIFFGFHTSEVENEFHERPQFRTTGYQAQLTTAITDYFDIRGVTGSFDAACASSFAAFHQAVLNLRAGLVDTAIVCGVNISVRPGTSYQFLLLQMLSPTGSSKFLDAAADGYAKTEACVSVVLKRADLARRAYASIVHTKCNNDGFKVEGITFPSSAVQEALMQGAIVESGVDPNQIVYVEAHGTGTPAGDPEEARAIAKVYCGPTREQPLLIGSVKSNMGHAEGVSGLCSLAKVIGTFEHELLPRNLHYYKPNPNIEPLLEGRLKPVNENIPFKHNLIPMNCYGFGGVNVHGIFKSVSKPAKPETLDIAPQFPRLITMFGRTQAAVEHAFAEFKRNGDGSTVGDDGMDNKRILTRDFLALIDSINDGPVDRLMNYRGYLLVDEELNEIDSSIAEIELPGPVKRDEFYNQELKNDCIMFERMKKEFAVGKRETKYYQDTRRQVWFMLPGLGSQWRAMGKKLQAFPPVWNTIEELVTVLKPLGVDLLAILTDDSSDYFSGPNSNVNLFTGIVAVQIGLLDLLSLLRVKPDAIIGHSIGEIACAYADGLLNAAETVRLAYHLAKPIDDAQLHSGAMVAVSLGARQVEKYIESFEASKLNVKAGASSIQVACMNGDESVTLSGEAREIDAIIETFTEDNVYARRVPDVKTAFHSSALRQVEKQMLESAQRIFNNNNIVAEITAKNWRSTVKTSTTTAAATNGSQDGLNLSGNQNESRSFAINAQYYVDNLCSPVLFKEVTDQIEPEETVVVEVGPHRLFQPILKQKFLTKLNYVSLMKRADGSINSLLKNLGQLYQRGVTLALANLYPPVEFPVCKGTASVSSLVRWNHSQQFYVAKYPDAFRKPPCEARVLFDLIDESDKYLAGHCVDGRILFPATGYLYLVWRSYSLTRDKVGNSPLISSEAEHQLVPVEFKNVRLYRATILGSAPVEIMVRLEEATGQFEVREGGSVVVDGYIAQPTVNPNGMLYESVRELAKAKKRELSLTTDDVYKQFRVNGYDYGDTFRNIVAASADGLHIQVKWEDRFIPFSDSVLQSLFLAICKRTSALFLPTKFEYMRINPRILQEKVDAAAMAEQSPCIMDAYCELETGIIVTDGIEMRGVGASPAPRRPQQEPLMETYEFVPNIERHINDKLCELQNRKLDVYAQMCASAACKIIENLRQPVEGTQTALAMTKIAASAKCVHDDELVKYLDEHDSSKDHVLLAALDKILASQEEPEEKEVTRGGLEREPEPGADCDNQEDGGARTEPSNDAAGANKIAAATDAPARKRRVNPNLKPAAWLQKAFDGTVKAEFGELAPKMGADLLSSPFITERYLRPLLEMVLENTQSQNIKMLELNTGNGIKYEHAAGLLSEIAPNITINYFLGHPNSASIQSGALPQDAKLYKWTPAAKALARELQDVDVVLYSDSSCYPSKKGQFDITEVARDETGAEIEGAASVSLHENLESVFASVADVLRANGFLLVMLRTCISQAERFLYKSAEFEVTQTEQRMASILDAQRKVPAFRLVAEKSDLTGCHMLLFRKLDETLKIPNDVRAIHIEHGKSREWLELLKKTLADAKAFPAGDTTAPAPCRAVWLIANDVSVNGALGMVTCLRKEPGGEKLRLVLDQRRKSPLKFTTKRVEFERVFKVKDKDGNEEEKREPASSSSLLDLESPELDAALVELMKTDLVFNCFDLDGRFGSFRHFTISELLDSLKTRTPEAYVNVATRGDLSSFKWYEAPYKYIAPEVRAKNLISIYYSSLNFRDIMLASGRLPLDALPVSVALSDCILGLEFSGRAPDGRRIAGMLGGRGIGTTAVVDEKASICFNLPERMSLEEGATIPVGYATALMALCQRGRMRAGESILVHSGSGGVGQAAIRLALHYNLTVYTTVGNQEKRDFLKAEFPVLTDAHIFNSRDCSFETDVLRATNGRGVDLVLNSLSEDKLQASVRCLADGGRFLEIGKYDMALNNPVELMLLDTNKTFHGILLDKLFDTETITNTYRSMTEELAHCIERGLFEGWIEPIKRTIFDKTEVEDAFRFMASGKHIGKVVIKMREEELRSDHNQSGGAAAKPYMQVPPKPVLLDAIPRTMFNPTLSYIITGGLGGFGLELSKWMTANGCKQLVLTSRAGVKTGYQQLVVDRLISSNVNVLVSTVDNSTDAGAEELIAQATAMAPLGGIINLAMVLRDAMFENQSVENFEAVCKPKCDGVEALDRVTRRLFPRLPLFVVFSSVSCGKGNPGQANYGYANSVMERVCELRRRDGMHGLAIQWGAIGDVGVAFEHLGGNEAVIGGTLPQRMPSCFATLSKFITSPFTTCLSILQADRRSFSAGKKGDLVKTILHVLGIKDPSTVDPNCTLGELGLDSLMAVEIRQALEREYEIVLTVQEIRALTINRIREIGEGEGKPGAAAAAGAGAGGASAVAGAQSAAGAPTEPAANIVYQTESADVLTAQVPGVTVSTGANGERVYTVDKNIAARAPTSLAKHDLLLLNGDTGVKLSGNPIFFLPPIQGDFARLSVLSKKFSRPCIGIAWTERMAHLDNTHDVAVAHVAIVRKYYPQLKTLDLVGYSFGAAMAFEVAAYVQNSSQLTPPLSVGKVVLLDGSPAQINIGVHYLTNTLDTQEPAAQVTELMTAFLMQHGRFDYASLKQQIMLRNTNEQKLKFTSELLAKSMGLQDAEQVKNLADAEEAFCRRFQIMLNYKQNPAKLDNDVTLIRATELYVGGDRSVDADYGLSKSVNGRVNSCLIKGNHESFLDDNVEEIGSLLRDVICPILE